MKKIGKIFNSYIIIGLIILLIILGILSYFQIQQNIVGKVISGEINNELCIKHSSKGCILGKEDVYWFDSCGNPEEIAEDCDFSLGTYCGNDLLGKYICKDFNCVIDGKLRKNNESWCEYDNVIGNGKDPVGSRHMLHKCENGTEKILPCADFRKEICAETNTSGFSQAECRINKWKTCLELNLKNKTSEMKNLCNKNPDCWVKHINMVGSFQFDVCLPQYPPGFELYDKFDENALSNSGDSICSIASQRCTETWICTLFGCFCVDNCKCSTKYFTEEMNEFCISLGDCGAYINYDDIWTGGGHIVKKTGNYGGGPRILNERDSEIYKARAGTKPAKPNNFSVIQETDSQNLSFEMAARIGSELSSSIYESFFASIQSYLISLSWIQYVYYDFSCGMWERPSRNAECNKCNKVDVPCSKYRCQSLGELCKFINESSGGLCLEMNPLISIEPLMSVITKGYKYDFISEKGFEIRKENGECVYINETVNIGINLNPFAKCRFDKEPKKWDEMSNPFGANGERVLPVHQINLSYHNNSKYELFIKCKTAYGEENIYDYSIGICFTDNFSSSQCTLNSDCYDNNNCTIDNCLNNNCIHIHNCTNIISPICIPVWQCSSWNRCLNNRQTRNCIDINNCNINEEKPSEAQNCFTYKNIALNKQTTATASDFGASSQAVDGNIGTSWNAGMTDNQNITIYLGMNYQVSGYSIRCEGSYGGNAGTIYFYYGNTLVETKTYSGCNYSNIQNGIVSVFSNPVNVTKVVIAGRQTDDSVNVAEFELYGYVV